jgi:parallel beta-helix repeat protein
MIKKIVIATVISAFLISLIATVQVIDVTKAEPVTLVVPTDYSTIQQAIDHSSDGDTIYIKKGTYAENPIINKSIILIGEDRDTTIIDMTAGRKVERNDLTTCLRMQHDDVTITGLTIFGGWLGIEVFANYCNISGNKIMTSQNCIELIRSENCIVIGNVFHLNGTSTGIHLLVSNNNIISQNNLGFCTEGITIRQQSSNNTITKNSITNCDAVALLFLEAGAYNIVKANNMSNSKYGTIVYGSSHNTITNNNFVNNTIQLSTNESYYLSFGYNRSVNTIVQNFWSDYDGIDANVNGVGDTPYIIDPYNNDSQPLMLPFDINNAPDPTPNPTPTLCPSPTSSLIPTETPTPSPTVPEFPTWTIMPLAVITVVAAILAVRRRAVKGFSQ